MRTFSLILVALLSVTPAAAEGPPAPPRPSGSPGPRGPHRPPLLGSAAGSASPLPSGFQERMRQHREQLPDHIRDRMERMQGRGHDSRERHARSRKLSGEIAEQLRSGNPRPEELKKQLEELRLLRNDRRNEQRASLRQRWGESAHKPDVKDELERHARRLARLQRLEVIAATERTGDQRKRLIARIEQLRTLEDKRHEQAMKKLAPEASAGPEASASAAPVAPAPAAGSALPPASGGSL